MRVSALLGGGKRCSPGSRTDAGYPEITAYIEGVAAYNTQVPAPERFSGVHLDIEPDMSDDYRRYRSQLRRFLPTHAGCVTGTACGWKWTCRRGMTTAR